MGDLKAISQQWLTVGSRLYLTVNSKGLMLSSVVKIRPSVPGLQCGRRYLHDVFYHYNVINLIFHVRFSSGKNQKARLAKTIAHMDAVVLQKYTHVLCFSVCAVHVLDITSLVCLWGQCESLNGRRSKGVFHVSVCDVPDVRGCHAAGYFEHHKEKDEHRQDQSVRRCAQ